MDPSLEPPVPSPIGTAQVTLALLLLGDGRFPTGSHAHSGGIEAAVSDGRVHDLDTLATFVRGRVHSVGLTEAALAAATNVRLGAAGPSQPSGWATWLDLLDAEAECRTPVPHLRVASRRLGRQLARAGARCWPSALGATLVSHCPAGAHQPVALGAVSLCAGLGPEAVACLSLQATVTTASHAALRLLGLDPFALASLAAELAPECAELASRALEAAVGPPADLPAVGAPAVELASVGHATRDGRLFAT